MSEEWTWFDSTLEFFKQLPGAIVDTFIDGQAADSLLHAFHGAGNVLTFSLFEDREGLSTASAWLGYTPADPFVRDISTEVIGAVIGVPMTFIGGGILGGGKAIGNTGVLLTNPRTQYSISNLLWDPRTYNAVRTQYWRVSGGARGMNLHHWLFQNQSRWIPQGLRNAGFNLLELPAGLNRWAGGRLPRVLGIRLGILTLGATATSSGYHAGKNLGELLGSENIVPIYIHQSRKRPKLISDRSGFTVDFRQRSPVPLKYWPKNRDITPVPQSYWPEQYWPHLFWHHEGSIPTHKSKRIRRPGKTSR